MAEANNNIRILITGAAGFIGSCTAQHFNHLGFTDLLLVDDFGEEAKRRNWESLERTDVIERQSLEEWLNKEDRQIDIIIHLGARTDTTEFNYAVHEELNVEYSKMIWKYCAENFIPLIYASSAATYGDGSLGYSDDHELPFKLSPLNPYGVSKNEFDKWALQQNITPPSWAGLKFFNVYGQNEYHKGRMASVIWHAFNQIKNTGQVKLFKSHKEGFEDGQQLRDFIYVNDITSVIEWMTHVMLDENKNFESGLFNLGTGKARSFYDLAQATFNALRIKPNIIFIDMPEDIRDKYQYYTEAKMEKLRKAGYNKDFASLEEGVNQYVVKHLLLNFTM